MKLPLFALAGLLAGTFQGTAKVVAYPAPAGETLSTQYTVKAGGRPVPVYTARVLDPPFAGKEYDYGGPYSFAGFDVSGPVEVRIWSEKPLGNLVVRPANPWVKTRLADPNTAIVSLPGPCKLSIEPDGKNGPLLLFANAVEKNPPRASEVGPRLIYYGPGIHRPGKITLTNNQALYLAGGAVVKGGIVAEGDNIRIFGRGILDGSDWEWRNGPTPGATAPASSCWAMKAGPHSCATSPFGTWTLSTSPCSYFNSSRGRKCGCKRFRSRTSASTAKDKSSWHASGRW